MTDFTLAAGPGTDIWKKPPTTDIFNGKFSFSRVKSTRPVILNLSSLGRKIAPYRPHSSGPLTSFLSTTVSFTAPYTTQYDQAGLLLTITKPSSPSTPRRWIKTGVEFYNGQPRVSTVCCDSYADWSVAPVARDLADGIARGDKPVTVRVERAEDENGVGFWVYYVPEDGSDAVPLREIAWVYAPDGGEGWEIEVSAAVARPNKDVKGQLEAKFSKLEVNWETK